MATTQSTHITVHETLRNLARRKRLLLTTFGLFAAIILLLVLIRRDTYSSAAKLFVRIGRESVALDPTATTGQTLSLHASRETEINSILEMFRSRAILEKTVDAIGTEQILDTSDGMAWVGYLKEQASTVKKWLKGFVASSPAEGDSDREEAIAQLIENIGVMAPERSTVISVTCKASSPQRAQKIVDTMVKVCIDDHARSNRTAGSHEFFRNQSELLRAQWTEKRKRLNELKNGRGIATIEGQIALLEQQKTEIALMRMRNSTELAAAKAKHTAIKAAIERMKPTILLQRVDGVENKASDGMRQQLYDLEIRERELLAKYLPDHPLLVAIQKQIEDARRIHTAQKNSRSQSTFGVDPAWQQLHAEELQEEARVASLAAMQTSVDHQFTEVIAQLRDLNTYALQHDALQSDIDRFAVSYAAYSESLEQSRIDHALQQQRITNVNVVQEASFVPKPIGPSRTVLAGLGMFIALVGAAGVTLFKDQLDQPQPPDQSACPDPPQRPRHSHNTDQPSGSRPLVDQVLELPAAATSMPPSPR